MHAPHLFEGISRLKRAVAITTLVAAAIAITLISTATASSKQAAAGTIAVTERTLVLSYRDGNDIMRELQVRPTLTGTFSGTEVSLAHNVTHPDSAGAERSIVDRQLQELKAATARYHSIEQAIAAGYLPPGGQMPPPSATCVTGPTGNMGYHFENPALMTDGVINLTEPEVLLYERMPNGTFKLTAVEYYMQANQTTTAPVILGQTFLGPMPPHHPGMTVHYDRHVWLWKDNPNGLYDNWNPTISCP